MESSHTKRIVLVPIFGEETSIAWEAHIGGFVVGLLLFPLLDRGQQRR